MGAFFIFHFKWKAKLMIHSWIVSSSVQFSYCDVNEATHMWRFYLRVIQWLIGWSHTGDRWCMGRMISGICDFCLCVFTLWKENGLNSHHQTWYTYTLWQSLSMHWARGQKVKNLGHTVMKTITVAWLLVKCAAAADMGLHVVWLLRFLVVMNDGLFVQRKPTVAHELMSSFQVINPLHTPLLYVNIKVVCCLSVVFIIVVCLKKIWLKGLMSGRISWRTEAWE